MSPSPSSVTIRREGPRDREAVRKLLIEAFDTSAEANLVDVLRSSGCHWISLIAELEGEVVGHIVFTPVGLKPPMDNLRIAGLAPMAVLPSHQREGIGSMLVESGKAQCWVEGYDAIVVLGPAEYYPRFGFTPASRFGLSSEYDVPDEVFMALELKSASLADANARVLYQPAFGEL